MRGVCQSDQSGSTALFERRRILRLHFTPVVDACSCNVGMAEPFLDFGDVGVQALLDQSDQPFDPAILGHRYATPFDARRRGDLDQHERRLQAGDCYWKIPVALPSDLGKDFSKVF
jgi:hypothetical protein